MAQEESEKKSAEKEYEVGYRKPPKKNQFKKGQSGNPSGKKKGGKPWQDGFVELLFEHVSLNINGDPRRMSTFEGMMRSQIARGFKSDRAFANIMRILKEIEEQRSTEQTQQSGVLVVPAQMEMEDWMKVAEEQQRKYRDGSFYENNKP